MADASCAQQPPPQNPCEGKANMTACTLNGQAGICCNQECKVGGNCCNDNDCPPGGPNNLVKGKCDTNTHTCYWPPCKYNSDCVDNSCCDRDPTGPGGAGVCVSQGIYSSNTRYLCDPPNGWNSKEAKTQNILEVILDFFSYFFQR